jgi:hypothetical protein
VTSPGNRNESPLLRNALPGLTNMALVQMALLAETIPIAMDTLSIKQDGIPDSGRSGIFEPEHREVELTLANAMHQFDA